MANLAIANSLQKTTTRHEPQFAGYIFGSVNDALNGLSGKTYTCIGELVTVSGTTNGGTITNTSELGVYRIASIDNKDAVTLVKLADGDGTSSADVTNLQTAVGTTTDAISVSPLSSTTVTDALKELTTYFKIVKVADSSSSSAYTYNLCNGNDDVLSSFSVDKDKFLKSATTVTVDDEQYLRFTFSTYDGTSYGENTVDVAVSDMIGYKPLSSTTINGYTLTFDSDSVSLSGSDINIGELYQEVQQPINPITNLPYIGDVSGITSADTIVEGFQKAEVMISALTTQVLANEEVIQTAIGAIVSGSGLINSNDEITYTPLSEDSILQGATSLYEADRLLSQAIQAGLNDVQTSVTPYGELSDLIEISNNGLTYVANPKFDCGVFDSEENE